MLFWIFAGLLSILAVLILISPILGGRKDATVGSTSDVAVYRDQLKELDADIARGVLGVTEADASRLEISRRLLAADERQTAAISVSPRSSSNFAVAALMAAVTLGSLVTYNLLGSPETPDQPLAERTLRLTQEQAEQQFATNQAPRELDARETELLSRLRDALKQRPDDLQGHRLLASTLNSIGDFAGAASAQKDVIRILADEATTDDFAEIAEFMIFAAGGYVSPETDQALARALQLNSTNQRARYYSGVSMAQNGKPELAMQLWAGLLKEGDDNAPWKEPVREQMRSLASANGLQLPESLLRGPTQEDVDAASDMSDQDREAMIKGMVDNLSDRLANEGGTPAEWARLIRALGVLGNLDQANAIFVEAKNTFAEDASAIAAVTEAAESVGLE